MRLLFCIFTLLFSLRPLCAKRPKIWQKKRCKRNCDKKNIEKKTSTEIFECARASAPVVRCCKGKWTLWYQKKIMNLSPAIHCTRTVCSRVRAPFNFLKLCDCDICQFAKQVWSPPLLLYYYPPKNHTLWYSCQVVRIVWCDRESLLLQRVCISWALNCAVCVTFAATRANCQLLRVRLCRRVCLILCCVWWWWWWCELSACVVSINNNKYITWSMT